MTSTFDAAPFAVACPACRATVGVGRDLVGSAASCPLCAANFRVPDPGPVPSDEPAPCGERQPAAPAPVPDDRPTSAVASLPTLQVEQPPRRIPGPDGMIELRRLSPEEKARRRLRRNLVLVVCGVAILLVLAATLAR